MASHAARAPRVPTNAEVASQLEGVAALLEAQDANPFRVQAWRNGAATIRGLDRPAADILRDDGLEGLDALPGIGSSLARAIREIVETGRLGALERLRGEHDPLALLASVPGIGHRLAERVHDALGVESLEELERAAHDGRLAALEGFGEKRIAGIRDALESRLRRRRRPTRVEEDAIPPVDELLDVDAEYRLRAEAGDLPMIAPRRFNPTHEAWLPVLHTSRDRRQYTVLFSNTAQAHQRARTHDWVVIYVDGGSGAERQHTVVTEGSGALAGRRVVRGRETECAAYYANLDEGDRARPPDEVEPELPF